MKVVKKQPITGGKTEYSKKNPLIPDAKETSLDAQTMISEAPQPFKNKNTTPNIPAASAAPGGVSTMEPKIQSGLQRTQFNAKTSHPSGGAVGYKSLPDQSKQIGKRTSVVPSPRVSGNNRNQPSAKKKNPLYS